MMDIDANGSYNQESDMDNMDREQRRGFDRSRSRSPFDKGPKQHNRSRDSSISRNTPRQIRNNRSRSASDSRGDRKRTRAPTNRRVYVANIPYDCKWTTVKDLFREKVGDVSYVELFEDESGKFRGCGIVELKEALSVQKAVDVLHRFEFRGRQLVVKEDFDVDRDKTGKPLPRGGRLGDRDRDDFGGIGGIGGIGGSINPQYNTYGLSPQFLDSLGIAGPLTSRVFVANLDYKVTPQKLEEVFKLAGKVVKIELKKDEDGNSKGHGTIEMGHPVEAVQAISMFNGQKFFNRTMSVRMDKKHRDDTEDKRLPEGLQSVGKGLGANGLPLQLGSAAGGVGNIGATGITPMGAMGGVGAGNLGLMQNNQMNAGAAAAAAAAASGLGGIGMGLGIGADRSMVGGIGTGLGVGLGGAGQPLGLGNTAATGIGNPNLMGGGLGNAITSTATGLANPLGGGLGTSLAGGLGGATGLSLGGNTGGAGGGIGGYGEYDRTYDRSEDAFRNTRSSDTVIVRNLPASYTWQTLRDRFRDIGDVRFTEMKGRGSAVIRFTTERDAQRAVDLMHGIRIDGRPIDVTLY